MEEFEQGCDLELLFATEPRGKAARIASGRLPQGTGRIGSAYGYCYEKAT